MKVLELNDSAVRVLDRSGVLASSPGFALVDGKQLRLGEDALRQTRLRPTQSFNRFWHQLSLDPLPGAAPVARHAADLAFAHLQHLAKAADHSGDVILAVPGHFSREQLAILLGLIKHSPFNAVGVVDGAVAAAARLARSETVLYLDMHLHQVLVSRLNRRDDSVIRDAVVQIPGVGRHDLLNQMMNWVNALFIQQCRFNPQHRAITEQQVFDALPEWLAQGHDLASNLTLGLQVDTTLYEAKWPAETLVRKLSEHYQRIHDQVRALAQGEPVQILVSQHLAEFPGFMEQVGELGDVQAVQPEWVADTCMTLHPHFGAGSGEFHFVTRLPLVGGQPAPTPAATPVVNAEPTHVLLGHLALPLDQWPADLGRFQRQGQGMLYVPVNAGSTVNDQPVVTPQAVKAGDRVTAANSSGLLIRVQHGQG